MRFHFPLSTSQHRLREFLYGQKNRESNHCEEIDKDRAIAASKDSLYCHARAAYCARDFLHELKQNYGFLGQFQSGS